MYELKFVTEKKNFYSEDWKRLPALRISMLIKTSKCLHFKLLKDGKTICYGVRNSKNQMEFEGELPEEVLRLINRINPKEFPSLY